MLLLYCLDKNTSYQLVMAGTTSCCLEVACVSLRSKHQSAVSEASHKRGYGQLADSSAVEASGGVNSCTAYSSEAT